jgi:hypothetical protein
MPLYVEPGCATSQTGDPGGPSYSFERKGMVGGFAYLAAKVKTIRQSKEKGNTLLVHTYWQKSSVVFMLLLPV